MRLFSDHITAIAQTPGDDEETTVIAIHGDPYDDPDGKPEQGRDGPGNLYAFVPCDEPEAVKDATGYTPQELADLFAASPNLLTALEALVAWGRAHTSPTDPDSPHDLLISATYAINNARRK